MQQNSDRSVREQEERNREQRERERDTERERDRGGINSVVERYIE